MATTYRILHRSQSIIERVRRLLADSAPCYPSLEEVAQRLCMTPRTFKRDLARGGMRFQDLLDQSRYTQALALLEQRQMSVEQVADLVGYGSAANFSRAFRRWTGSAPGAFRGRLYDDRVQPAASPSLRVRNDSIASAAA